MRIFLSWSGDQSKAVASALDSWLPDVFQDLEVWMSAHSIDAGQRWGAELGSQLEATSFGVLCLTQTNLNAPWLLFEAGALSKVLENARVVPYLHHVSATDVPFPLAQFQGVEAEESGTLKLVQSINACIERSIPSDRLERLFAKWWPDLQQALANVPDGIQESSASRRSDRTLLEEILQTVRASSRVSEKSAKQVPEKRISPNIDNWRGVMIWDLSDEAMKSLTDAELMDFCDQAKIASNSAYPDAKENAIDRRIEAAKSIFDSRKKQSDA